MHQNVPAAAVDTAVSTTRSRICFRGVEPASPFGELLAEAVSVPATIVADGGVSAASGKWRGTVLGTALQWWTGDVAASAATPNEGAAEVLIDFFGGEPAGIPPQRLWRLVDGTGEPILNPFCLLEACCRAPFVASIFLIERAAGDSGWTVLAEAHIGNCCRYSALLDRAAHIAAHLVAAALSKTPSAGEKAFHATLNVRRRSKARVAAQQTESRPCKNGDRIAGNGIERVLGHRRSQCARRIVAPFTSIACRSLDRVAIPPNLLCRSVSVPGTIERHSLREI